MITILVNVTTHYLTIYGHTPGWSTVTGWSNPMQTFGMLLRGRNFKQKQTYVENKKVKDLD